MTGKLKDNILRIFTPPLLHENRFTDRITSVGRGIPDIPPSIAEVAEWQTRYVQGVVSKRHESSNLSFGTIFFALVAQLDRAQPCEG
jgi:hypothetical protein